MRIADISGPHPFAFLSRWREKAGLTQAQVAAHFDVSDVTVHRWEAGKAPITVQNFVLLAQLFGAETPGHLLFPPNDLAEAASLRDAHVIIAELDPDDLHRWLEIGRALAEKRQRDQRRPNAA